MIRNRQESGRWAVGCGSYQPLIFHHFTGFHRASGTTSPRIGSSGKQRSVAPHRIAEQSFIRGHLTSRLMPRNQLYLLPDHRFSWRHGSRAQRDHNNGTQTKADIVGWLDWNGIKDRLRRQSKIDRNFGGRHWQPLSRADIERYVGPAPAIDVQPDSGEGLDM